MAVIIILAALAVCIVLFVLYLISMMRPTTGDKIAEYENPRQALLVIDIQEDFTGAEARGPFKYKNSGEVIETVNRLIEEASKNNVIVAYVRHEIDAFIPKTLARIFTGGAGIKGSPGIGIDRRVSIVSDHVFSKSRGDAFSDPAFESFLIENQVDEIHLVGLDAQYCIYQTAMGGLNRGYKVHILTDGILLNAEKKWDRIIDKYKQNNIGLKTSDEPVFAAG